MPGKSGPEYIKIRKGSTDNFLLTGSVPLPKPSYRGPNRTSTAPVRSLSYSGGAIPTGDAALIQTRRTPPGDPAVDFEEDRTFSGDEKQDLVFHLSTRKSNKPLETLESGNVTKAAPVLPLAAVSSDSVTKQPFGNLSGIERLRVIEERENYEEKENDSLVVEEFAEFHKTRSLFEGMASQDGSHIDTTKQDSHPSSHQDHLAFSLTQPSPDHKTLDQENHIARQSSTTERNSANTGVKGSQEFVNQVKEHYEQASMTSSVEELRDLTGAGGRDSGRPPHPVRDSPFTAARQGSSLQMRSSLRVSPTKYANDLDLRNTSENSVLSGRESRFVEKMSHEGPGGSHSSTQHSGEALAVLEHLTAPMETTPDTVNQTDRRNSKQKLEGVNSQDNTEGSEQKLDDVILPKDLSDVDDNVTSQIGLTAAVDTVTSFDDTSHDMTAYEIMTSQLGPIHSKDSCTTQKSSVIDIQSGIDSVAGRNVFASHTGSIHTRHSIASHAGSVAVTDASASPVHAQDSLASHIHSVRAQDSSASHTGSVRAQDSSASRTGSVRAQDSSASHTGSVRAQDSSASHTGSVRAQDSSASHTGSVRAQDSSASHTGSIRAQDSPASHTGSVRAQDSSASHTGSLTSHSESPHGRDSVTSRGASLRARELNEVTNSSGYAGDINSDSADTIYPLITRGKLDTEHSKASCDASPQIHYSPTSVDRQAIVNVVPQSVREHNNLLATGRHKSEIVVSEERPIQQDRRYTLDSVKDAIRYLLVPGSSQSPVTSVQNEESEGSVNQIQTWEDSDKEMIEDSIGSPLSNAEIKRYLQSASHDTEYFNVRGNSPSDGRFIDVSKMIPDDVYFTRISADEFAAATVGSSDTQRLHNPTAKTPSDIGGTAVESRENKRSSTGTVKAENLHGILISGHVGHKDSKVHFDDSHLSETKFFKKANGKLISDTNEGSSHRTRAFASSDLQTDTSGSSEEIQLNTFEKTRVSPNGQSDKKKTDTPKAKSAFLIGKPVVEKKKNALEKHVFGSMPHIAAPAVNEIVQNIQPLVLEELAAMEGHDNFVVTQSLSREIVEMILDIIARAQTVAENGEFIQIESDNEMSGQSADTVLSQRTESAHYEQQASHDSLQQLGDSGSNLENSLRSNSSPSVELRDVIINVLSKQCTERTPKRRHTICAETSTRPAASDRPGFISSAALTTSPISCVGASEYVQRVQNFDSISSNQSSVSGKSTISPQQLSSPGKRYEKSRDRPQVYTSQTPDQSACKKSRSRGMSVPHLDSRDSEASQVVSRPARKRAMSLPGNKAIAVEGEKSTKNKQESDTIGNLEMITGHQFQIRSRSAPPKEAEGRVSYPTPFVKEENDRICEKPVGSEHDKKQTGQTANPAAENQLRAQFSESLTTGHPEKKNKETSFLSKIKDKDRLSCYPSQDYNVEDEAVDRCLLSKLTNMETFVKCYPHNFDYNTCTGNNRHTPDVDTSRLRSLLTNPPDRSDHVASETPDFIEREMDSRPHSTPVKTTDENNAAHFKATWVGRKCLKHPSTFNDVHLSKPEQTDKFDPLDLSFVNDVSKLSTAYPNYKSPIYKSLLSFQPGVKESTLSPSQRLSKLSPKYESYPPRAYQRYQHGKYMIQSPGTLSKHLEKSYLTDRNKNVTMDAMFKSDVYPYALSSFGKQTTTASLPGSRGASPNPDTALSTGRRSALGADMRSYIVDKEVTESQLRKLKVENASLQSENKLLKEKYNRAQTRVQSLESQLLNSQSDGVDNREAEYIRKSNELNDYDRQQLEDKIDKLTREVQLLKTANASLEKELANSRLSSSVLEQSGDRSAIIAAFRTELTAVREEMSQVKRVLEQAERDRHDETERRHEATTKVVKLTEMKALLQQKLEGSSGGGVAEKQVKSLEKRLKLTEDRLHQERADRAGKLSQVEEKLIHENAQLQVAEKELRRQLQREQDKNRNVDHKYKECREENDKLRVIVSDKMPSEVTWSTLRDSLSGKQQVRAELESSEERADHYKHLYEDCKHEKYSLESTLTSQIKALIQDKHTAQAKIHNLEDENAAIRVERDALHTTGKIPTISTSHKHEQANTFEAEVESLRSELRTARAELQQQLRHNKLLHAESESMRIQLLAKEGALNEALEELARGVRTGTADRDVVEKYQHQTDALNDEKLVLEKKLYERDQELLKLTVDSNEKENAMKRNKQVLANQQQEVDLKMAEKEQLQLQLRQKTRLLEQMGSTEANHQVELTSLKQSLNECNQQLSQYENELKSKTVELNRMKALAQSMENELNEKNSQLSADFLTSLNDGVAADSSSPRVLTHAESKAVFLQTEIHRLKHQVQSGNEAVEEVIQENTQLLSRLRELQQNLVTERAQLCQLTCEKVETDQRLNIAEEETASLVKEKSRLEHDYLKQELECTRLREQIGRASSPTKTDFHQTYSHLDEDGKKAVTELMTCRRLLDARERENDLLRETNERQKHEITSLNYKVAVFKEESQSSQKDIDRLSNHWTTQIKESASEETVHAIATERAKLQLEKLQLEKDVNKDHEELQNKSFEVSSLQKRLEKSEENLRQTEKQLHEKENRLVALETDMRHQDKHVAELESERSDLKSQLTRCKEELQNMSGLNHTLEHRLSLEKNSLTKEKSDRDYLNDELGQTTRHLDSLKVEFDIVVASLEKEKQVVQTLKDKCQADEKEVLKLEMESRSQQSELASLKGQLQDCQQAAEGHLKDKQTLYQEVQELCEEVAEKEQALARLQEMSEESIETTRKDFSVEKVMLMQEQQRLQQDVHLYKERVDELKEQLRQKEMQLDVYVQTNKNLEGDVKVKYDLENEVSKLETELNETKRSLSRLEGEHSRLSEQCRRLQESYENQKEQVETLETDLRHAREDSTQECAHMQQQLQQETHRHDLEKMELQDKLNKTMADLKATSASLASVQEAKESLSASYKSAEKSIDTLKTQVHEESTGRKLAEQRIESLTAQLEDTRLNRNDYDEKSTELHTRLGKLENDWVAEKDKNRQLKHELEVAQLKLSQLESQSQNIAVQLEEATAENISLKGQLETLKQDLVGKNKRLSLEMQQSSENYDRDRSKLVAQADQLSTDLDASREQVAAKNRENLQLKEQILTLEGRLRETTTDVKQLKESLAVEEQTRDKLDKRNMELELLLAKIRSKDSDISYETNKAEVQKMLNELSKNMQDQLENQKGSDSELLTKERKRTAELKKKLASVESHLSQEQAMHIVSKTSIQSLEDENQRLRTQVTSLRRRLANATHHESDRNKSRIEEINEIIAKSQNRARQMLAAGNFNPSDHDPFKLNTSFNPLHLDLNAQPNLPNSQYWRMTSSPRPNADANRSVGSDDINLGTTSCQ